MIKNYTIKEGIGLTYYFGDDAFKEMQNYKTSFLACCSLLSDYFGFNHFIVLFIDKEYDEQKNTVKSLFKVRNSKAQYYLELDGDTCSISSENMRYTWRVWDTECELIYISQNLSNKTIIQEILPHTFKIEVKINGKIWRMNVPIDIYSTYDFDFLDKIIKETTKVEDLQRIYYQYFYKEQSNYDRTLDTHIQYFECINGKEVLIDELVIKNGKIISYLFSNYKGNIILSNKNGIIEIRNYSLDEQIDLNGEVINLLKRGKKQS